MHAEQLLREGKPSLALAALEGDVRKAPADPKLRVFLFQVLAVLGQWERALKQLQVAAGLDAAAIPMAQAYRELIGCELFRAEVFAGRRTPSVLGEPPLWMGSMLKALELSAGGKHAEAESLRDEALALAPASTGKLNDQRFEWLADADSRLGPVLEVIVKGRYYFLPVAHVAALHLEPPVDLRDLVWAPARLTLSAGGEVPAFIPTRYPGTELDQDDGLKLARKTVWEQPGSATYLGRGQRVFTTDQAELGLLEVRSITLDAVPPPPSASDHA
jgi:type VI secretion system protein ImpE